MLIINVPCGSLHCSLLRKYVIPGVYSLPTVAVLTVLSSLDDNPKQTDFA